MAHVLSGRAETPTQSRILTFVRDGLPLSRMDLGGPAQRLAHDRPGGSGAARGAGSRRGRWALRPPVEDVAQPWWISTPGLRFIGVELGATSMRIAMTDGRLDAIARASIPRADIRRGPETVLAEVIEHVRKLLADHGVERPAGIPVGVPGPVDFQVGVPVSPPIMPGLVCGTLCPRRRPRAGQPLFLLDNDVNVMALGDSTTALRVRPRTSGR